MSLVTVGKNFMLNTNEALVHQCLMLLHLTLLVMETRMSLKCSLHIAANQHLKS